MAKLKIEIEAETKREVIKGLNFLIEEILKGAKVRNTSLSGTDVKLRTEGEYKK